MQWHDVTRKILGGGTGRPGKIVGGQWPLPSTPLAQDLSVHFGFPFSAALQLHYSATMCIVRNGKDATLTALLNDALRHEDALTALHDVIRIALLRTTASTNYRAP